MESRTGRSPSASRAEYLFLPDDRVGEDVGSKYLRAGRHRFADHFAAIRLPQEQVLPPDEITGRARLSELGQHKSDQRLVGSQCSCHTAPGLRFRSRSLIAEASAEGALLAVDLSPSSVPGAQMAPRRHWVTIVNAGAHRCRIFSFLGTGLTRQAL